MIRNPTKQAIFRLVIHLLKNCRKALCEAIFYIYSPLFYFPLSLALLADDEFKDLYHYGLIMEEPSPKKCKDLGRLVSGFESTTWDNALREIIFHGNLGKFQSDIALVDALLETENAVLIEASPYDGIYGAGLTESDLLNPDGSLKVQPENWKNPKNGTQATNHLGFVLMGIRDLFRQLMGHSWRPGEEYKPL